MGHRRSCDAKTDAGGLARGERGTAPVTYRMNVTVIGFLSAFMTGCTWGGPGDV
jgi:hypothetical protein